MGGGGGGGDVIPPGVLEGGMAPPPEPPDPSEEPERLRPAGPRPRKGGKPACLYRASRPGGKRPAAAAWAAAAAAAAGTPPGMLSALPGANMPPRGENNDTLF